MLQGFTLFRPIIERYCTCYGPHARSLTVAAVCDAEVETGGLLHRSALPQQWLSYAAVYIRYTRG